MTRARRVGIGVAVTVCALTVVCCVSVIIMVRSQSLSPQEREAREEAARERLDARVGEFAQQLERTQATDDDIRRLARGNELNVGTTERHAPTVVVYVSGTESAHVPSLFPNLGSSQIYECYLVTVSPDATPPPQPIVSRVGAAIGCTDWGPTPTGGTS
jgi:hypothetical protein